ncbi:serine O-acetyltransferase [Cellulosimicrobium arenosum]|uniref:Serine acetyltransferase n=1 Tax=Cellulosimicrobium arenosum TaxID=2708133 RepID=A0A927IZZ4_9MICO|nr:serine acetyltransferase [Cellulosimicrobium arenosum]MBD8078953.1 serine acetyltransferase [Cellulosimicrobium arenosum]
MSRSTDETDETVETDRSTTSSSAASSFAELARLVREDHRFNSEGLWTPGFYAVAVHRLGAFAAAPGCPPPLRRVLAAIADHASLLVRNVLGIDVPRTVRLGRRVEFAHQHGIVIHPLATIGDECVVRQGVTIGAGSGETEAFLRQAPTIGARVSLGAGCVVVGAVTIGDDAKIGPNAVVMTNIPAGATVLAQPPRIVRARSTS